MNRHVSSPQPSNSVEAISSHLNYLDGLRALTALYVVVAHASGYVWPHTLDYHGLTFWLVGIFRYGYFAVGIFITLSGFCLMLPIVTTDGTLRGGAIKFYRRRARRILPPYYFALAMSLLLIWLLIGHKSGGYFDMSLPVTREGLLSHLLLLQNIVPDSLIQINAAFWSISVEWQIYFLFPLLIILRRRVGGAATTLTAVLVGYFIWFALRHSPFPQTHFEYIALFGLGMFGAEVAFSQAEKFTMLRERIPWNAAAFIFFAMFIVLSDKWGWQKTFIRSGYMDLLVGCATVGLLVHVSHHRSAYMHRVLSWKPLVFIGTYAYSIYLIHFPLLQVISRYLFQPAHLRPITLFLSLATIGTTLIVSISYLFFMMCERPFLNTKRHPALAETNRDAALSPAP